MHVQTWLRKFEIISFNLGALPIVAQQNVLNYFAQKFAKRSNFNQWILRVSGSRIFFLSRELSGFESHTVAISLVQTIM